MTGALAREKLLSWCIRWKEEPIIWGARKEQRVLDCKNRVGWGIRRSAFVSRTEEGKSQ